MATAKQITANQVNALASTGPRTAEGKAVAAQNALGHGLTAKAAVVPWENTEAFDGFRDQLRSRLRGRSRPC